MVVLGRDEEIEKVIPIHVGTIDCSCLRGRYPKSEKCSINSFSRAFRCNTVEHSMIYDTLQGSEIFVFHGGHEIFFFKTCV